MYKKYKIIFETFSKTTNGKYFEPGCWYYQILVQIRTSYIAAKKSHYLLLLIHDSKQYANLRISSLFENITFLILKLFGIQAIEKSFHVICEACGLSEKDITYFFT